VSLKSRSGAGKSRSGAIAAVLGLAASLFLATPSASAEPVNCTHSRAGGPYGFAWTSMYYYNSGTWKYVGSQLMHVHDVTYQVIYMFPYTVENRHRTYYCAK
jgi:hypothetical protein